MSAGEVERLVSELSGGTGGDEEEEWLYGGTELPVPFFSPGFSQASLSGPQKAGVLGPSHRRLGPLAWSLMRPDLGRARRARPPPPLPPPAQPTPPTRTHQVAAGTPLGRGLGAGPPASPSTPPGLLGRFASVLFSSCFLISILSCVGVSLLAP